VHHLRPLSEIGEEYLLNPEEDLRPVCANCHSMLHRRRTALGVEELREIISKCTTAENLDPRTP
jgi:5-methylcytosine-specific restriction enzyme A